MPASQEYEDTFQKTWHQSKYLHHFETNELYYVDSLKLDKNHEKRAEWIRDLNFNEFYKTSELSENPFTTFYQD